MTTRPAQPTPLPALFALRGPDRLDGASLPDRIRFLKWGRNDTTQGPFIVDDHTVSVLDANQRARGFGEVALDWEHNTVPGTPEYERTREPRSIAARGIIKAVKGEGLYFEPSKWTPDGERNYANYIDPSGAVAKDAQDRVVFVHSVALCRNGSAPDVTLLSASSNPPTTTMSDKNKVLTLAALAVALGLPDTATEADLADRLKPLSAAPPDLSPLAARLEALEKRPATGDVPATITALTARVTALEATRDQSGRDAIYAEAARDGKQYPLDRAELDKLPLATLRAMTDKLAPGVVPLHARARGTGADTTPPLGDRIAKQRAAMDTIRRRDNCSHEDAFTRAQAEQPALFA